MGCNHGSTGRLNGDQGCVQVSETVRIHAEVTHAEAGSRVDGDEGVIALGDEMDHDVVGKAPKRRDGDTMGEMFAAFLHLVMNFP